MSLFESIVAGGVAVIAFTRLFDFIEWQIDKRQGDSDG